MCVCVEIVIKDVNRLSGSEKSQWADYKNRRHRKNIQTQATDRQLIKQAREEKEKQAEAELGEAQPKLRFRMRLREKLTTVDKKIVMRYIFPGIELNHCNECYIFLSDSVSFKLELKVSSM